MKTFETYQGSRNRNAAVVNNLANTSMFGGYLKQTYSKSFLIDLMAKARFELTTVFN